MCNPPLTMLPMDVNFQIPCRICFCVALLTLMSLSLMSNCMLLHEPLRCELFLTIGARNQIFTSVQSLVDDQMFLEIKSFLAILAYIWWRSMLFCMLINCTEGQKFLWTMFTTIPKIWIISCNMSS